MKFLEVDGFYIDALEQNGSKYILNLEDIEMICIFPDEDPEPKRYAEIFTKRGTKICTKSIKNLEDLKNIIIEV